METVRLERRLAAAKESIPLNVSLDDWINNQYASNNQFSFDPKWAVIQTNSRAANLYYMLNRDILYYKNKDIL